MAREVGQACAGTLKKSPGIGILDSDSVPAKQTPSPILLCRSLQHFSHLRLSVMTPDSMASPTTILLSHSRPGRDVARCSLCMDRIVFERSGHTLGCLCKGDGFKCRLWQQAAPHSPRCSALCQADFRTAAGNSSSLPRSFRGNRFEPLRKLCGI